MAAGQADWRMRVSVAIGQRVPRPGLEAPATIRHGLSGPPVPFAQPGAVAYGPNTNAAAVLLASQGNVAIEWAAAVMAR